MATLADPSDFELLQAMRAGSEEAFTLLYRRRQAAVYRFALQMSGSAATAEDVTQEVFLALMRQAATYDPDKGSLSAYLYGVARHQVLRCLERERPFVSLAEPETEGPTPEALVAPADPLGDLTRNEMIDAVRGAVLALPPHYREVVVLCELHELSYGEAAEVIGCAVGTVRSRLHRGRGLLVDKLRSNNKTNPSAGDVKLAGCFA